MDVFFETAAERGGTGFRIRIHNATRLHTIVGSINANGYIIRFKQRLQGNKYLPGQALLHLRSLAKKSHDAVYLRQTDDFILRYIRYLGNTIDGDKMVLTGTGQIDILNFDHLIGAHLVINQGNLWKLAVIKS
jgi:hypothetical protein